MNHHVAKAFADMTTANSGPAHNDDEFLPLLRLKKPLMNASDDEWRTYGDLCMEWAEACEYLVIGGVGFEVLLATGLLPPIYERCFMVAANLLVALGIYFELLFSKRASHAQSELTQRSSDRLAKAEREAGEATDRASKAELETERLRALTAWRHVPEDVREELSAALHETADSIELLIEFQTSDPEAYSYAMELVVAFGAAGVLKIRTVANSYLSGHVFGVHVNASPSDLLSPGPGIARILSKSTRPVIWQPRDLSAHFSRSEPPPNLYVFVGPRVPQESNAHRIVTAMQIDSPREPSI